MKRFFIFAMSFGFVVSAQAGKMLFTCKNADGSILITRDKVVLLEKDAYTKQPNLIITNNLTANTMPSTSKDEIIEFGDEGNDGKLGSLKISDISQEKLIAKDDGGNCKGGHGPGFTSEAYKVKGQFYLYGEKAKKVELSCIESSSWSGNCEFDGE